MVLFQPVLPRTLCDPILTKLQSGTKPLEKIHKTRTSNLNDGKQRIKTMSHTPLPHTMLLLAGTFRSTLNGGGGGLEFYTNNRFARSSPVFNNFLNTFVGVAIASATYLKEESRHKSICCQWLGWLGSNQLTCSLF